MACYFQPALVTLCRLTYIAIRAGIYPQSESENALHTHAISRPPASPGTLPPPSSIQNSRVACPLSAPVMFSLLLPCLRTRPPWIADARGTTSGSSSHCPDHLQRLLASTTFGFLSPWRQGTCISSITARSCFHPSPENLGSSLACFYIIATQRPVLTPHFFFLTFLRSLAPARAHGDDGGGISPRSATCLHRPERTPVPPKPCIPHNTVCYVPHTRKNTFPHPHTVAGSKLDRLRLRTLLSSRPPAVGNNNRKGKAPQHVYTRTTTSSLTSPTVLRPAFWSLPA